MGGNTHSESAWAKRFPRNVEIILLLMKHVKDVECIILKQPQILIVLNSMVAVSQPTVDKIILVLRRHLLIKLDLLDCLNGCFKKSCFEGVNIIITHEPTFYSYADLEVTILSFHGPEK